MQFQVSMRRFYGGGGSEHKCRPVWLSGDKKNLNLHWLKRPKTVSMNEIWTRK